MSDTPTIKLRENGPYLVTNCARLRGLMDSKQYESQGTIALCRCGGSKNKPFCSGAHWNHHFDEDAPTQEST